MEEASYMLCETETLQRSTLPLSHNSHNITLTCWESCVLGGGTRSGGTEIHGHIKSLFTVLAAQFP